MRNAEIGVGCNKNQTCSYGCENADFCIKRNDTMPPLRMNLSDCDGAVDLTEGDFALEASMWFETKLKTNIEETDVVIYFADNLGFEQVNIGDVIIIGNRNIEHMLVLDIDESSKTIIVEREYNSTVSSSWKKGDLLRIFKFINQPSEIESVFEEIEQIDGTVLDELVETFMVFKWQKEHTELPGCYWFEFKLMKLNEADDVLWTKRIPMEKNGFLINIIDSFVAK